MCAFVAMGRLSQWSVSTIWVGQTTSKSWELEKVTIIVFSDRWKNLIVACPCSRFCFSFVDWWCALALVCVHAHTWTNNFKKLWARKSHDHIIFRSLDKPYRRISMQSLLLCNGWLMMCMCIASTDFQCGDTQSTMCTTWWYVCVCKHTHRDKQGKKSRILSSSWEGGGPDWGLGFAIWVWIKMNFDKRLHWRHDSRPRCENCGGHHTQQQLKKKKKKWNTFLMNQSYKSFQSY